MTTRSSRRGLALALALFTLAPAAEARAQNASSNAENAIGRALFPPELVMQHQQRIALTPAQRTAITTAIGQAQSRVVELQWRLQEEMQRFVSLLEASPVNEEASLAHFDRLLAVEREVKRAHMQLLIRIKNALTREQAAMLQSLR